MKKSLFLTLVFSVVSGYSAVAQTWSDSEQEVWKTILDCYDVNTEKNEAASLDCFHEDYSFWWSEYVLPFGIDRVRNGHHHFLETNTTVYTDLKPVGINVYGNTALVHFGAHGFTKDENGERGTWGGPVSMMMVKENGKWLYFGGAGSPVKK
jgi:hypothetical protein